MKTLSLNLLALVALAFFASSVSAQTAAFTYQGRLTDSAASANGTYDLRFALFNEATGGTQIGTTQTTAGVAVSNGVFTVALDFGAAAFDGSPRFLETSVKRAADAGYTTLTPRQPITSTPYAVRALKAATADTATNATNATTAATATDFSGNLTGDVTGTQTATVVSSVGGETAANVAVGAQAANAATSWNTPNAIVKRDPAGGFAAGVIGVSSSRLTVSAPDNAPEALRITNPELNSLTLSNLLLRMRSSSGNSNSPFLLTDRFRFDNAGGFVAIGELGYGIIPTSGAGVRMMWHPFKKAFRAGEASVNGEFDESNIGEHSWAGGYGTIARGLYSFAFGSSVTVTGIGATAFGIQNTVGGNLGFSSGSQNKCLGFVCTAIGYTAIADGQGAFALGYDTSAVGDYSFALGRKARTGCRTGDAGCTVQFERTGSFVFADYSTNDYMDATANNQFNVRARGGFRFRTSTATQDNVGVNGNTGCDLPGNSGVFNCASSRFVKENYLSLKPENVLQKIRRLPVMQWNYIGDESGERHIGPFAEDFQAAFKLSPTDKSIGAQDLSGVALIGVQALDERTTKLQAENETLRRQLAMQQTQFAALEERLKKLEQTAPRRRKAQRRK